MFVLFYLGVASGATVHFHYCMGELLSWGLTKAEADKCSNCGMDKAESGKCCKDVQQKVKVEIAQKAEFSFQFDNLISPVQAQQLSVPSVTQWHATIQEFSVSQAPPRSGNISVFLLNRTIRI